MAEPATRSLVLALSLALAAPADGAEMEPTTGPLHVVGTAAGGAGLIAASGLALVADGVSLIDANRLTRPMLRGIASRMGHRGALLLSQTSTGWIEGARSDRIERLPEDAATYLEAAPGYGRFDTFLTGASALVLAAGDLVAWLPISGLRWVGADAPADRLQRWRYEARVRALGPDPLPAATDP